MARYRIHVGQVVVEVESALTGVDAVRAAVEAGSIPEAAYYARDTAPIHEVTLVSGGEDIADAGQSNAAAEEPGASAPVLREGSAGGEVGAGESGEDSPHGEGLDPSAGAQSAQPA
jgi:hypothetical protein